MFYALTPLINVITAFATQTLPLFLHCPRERPWMDLITWPPKIKVVKKKMGWQRGMAKSRNCYCNNLFPSSNKLRMVWWKWKVKFKRKRCCLVGEKVKHKKLLSNKLIKIDLRKWFEPGSRISWLKMIIWVTEVMRGTVVGDWRLDNPCGSHLQGHSELDSDDGLRTGRQNDSRQQQSGPLRTAATQMNTFNQENYHRKKIAKLTALTINWRVIRV